MMALSKLEIWIVKILSSTQKVKGKESVVDCHLHLKPGSTMVNSRTTFTCFGLFRRVGKPEKPNRRRHAGQQLAPYWAIELTAQSDYASIQRSITCFTFAFGIYLAKENKEMLKSMTYLLYVLVLLVFQNQSLVLDFIHR